MDIKKELRDHLVARLVGAAFIAILMVALLVVNLKDIIEMGYVNADFKDWLLVIAPIMFLVYEIFNFKIVWKKLKELDQDA